MSTIADLEAQLKELIAKIDQLETCIAVDDYIAHRYSRSDDPRDRWEAERIEEDQPEQNKKRQRSISMKYRLEKLIRLPKQQHEWSKRRLSS
jgi:hypothetical protein